MIKYQRKMTAEGSKMENQVQNYISSQNLHKTLMHRLNDILYGFAQELLFSEKFQLEVSQEQLQDFVELWIKKNFGSVIS